MPVTQLSRKTAAMDDKALDFTTHFSSGYSVPEPQHSAGALEQIDDLGVIGESALKASGFYARIIAAAPSGRSRMPAETNVLVVEDDDGTALVIMKVLEKIGYPTRRARNRDEIVAALGATPMPDLVLLDIMLPDVNGFDVLNRIRQHPKLEKIPVLMLTLLSSRKDIAKGLAYGADGYVTKPALPSTLIDAVQAIIAG